MKKRTSHIFGAEGCFLTHQDLFEALDRFLQWHQLACMASENLRYLEGLGEKSLDLTSTCHCQLILLRQLIHPQNSNDVLEGLVVLEKESA